MKAKSPFLERNALASPALAPKTVPHDGPNLPISADGGSIRPTKPVIR